MKRLYSILFFFSCLALYTNAQSSAIESDTTVNFDNTQLDVNEAIAESEVDDEIYNIEDELNISKKVREDFHNNSRKRSLDQKLWDQRISDPKFQYKKPLPKKNKEYKQREMPKIDKNTWTIIAYSIIGIALSILIYAFLGTNPFSKRDTHITDHVEMDIEDVAHFTAWDQALLQAEQQGDYRKAIQVLYNETLQKLINANLIQYKKERTNRMYVNQLKDTIHYADFARHTRIFDYVWYGMATLSSDDYQSIKSSMKKAQSNILV